ncbi:hypothetical protein [Mycobacterium conspicuum]|jgi:hypothetical protein|uniref:Uncharacterized protein n=1 Tax=Mycobacterium conspicuum TaxID=44010 RepID=A0A1X1TLI9_9MYCO|nr:hypothetical protein [Mycobacterium conspicuum]ORV45393.1 hypothetical protein AWC00_06065 [Mycobacterium conspicuum]BBZ37017.1 hypothetical protein MCNS_00800 [Mycobacterium conspicuum]
MLISQRSIRKAATGAVGAAAVAGAMFFGGDATAQAAPAPNPGTSFATFGPHGGPGGPSIIPARPGGGWGPGGHGHGGGRGRGPGGFGRGGGFGHRGVFGNRESWMWRHGGGHGGFAHRGIFGNRQAWWWY